MLLLPCTVAMAIAGDSLEGSAAGQAVKPSGKSTAGERNKAFKWFNELGYPDVKDRKFVDVATGHWVTYGNDPTNNTFARGFLLEQKGDTFKILTLSLDELTFKKTPAGTPVWKQVSYEASDLKEGAAAYFKALRSPRKETDRQYSRFGEASLHSRTETFVVAWACWREGLHDLAAELFDHAARVPNGYGYNPDDPPKEPLQALVAADLAHTEMWRGVLAFGDPSISRTALLKKFEHIVKHYPASDQHKKAKATVDLLTKMIDEDTAHKKSANEFGQLSKKEQITELIFQLRDQNGHQYFQPGACDIFGPFSRKADTPAHKLVDIGYDAIPQLIEYLDDERFSRSVGFHRNFYFSHHVLRVGECAKTIISRIAGRSFYLPSDSKLTQEEVRAKEKADMKAWYAEFVKRGEKGFLIDSTERGDLDSAEMGRRLAEKYPKDALPILIKGARATKIGHVRATMVDLIASFKGEDSLQFLLTEINDGPFAQPRLTAAEELHKLGRSEGLAAMIAWWGRRSDPQKVAKEHDEDPGAWSWYIMRFLVSCGELEAMNALAKDLKKHPVNARLELIAALSGMDDGPYRREKKAAKDPAKMASTVEALLIAAFDDPEESYTSKDYPETRVCDLAAQVLSQLHPKKFTFDAAAHPSSRNRQLVIMKNVWNRANNLPPLPVPELRRIPAIPMDELRPILDRYLAAVGDKRLAVRNEIEKLGFGALPGVLERRDKTSEKTEQAIWKDLANRLSCIVAEIEIAEKSVKPNAIIAKRLDSLKGKPFDAKDFIETIGIILKNSPKDAQGFRVAVRRIGGGTGFSMKFDFLANPKNAKGPPSQWGFSESVKIGKAHVRSQFGATSDAGFKQWTGGNYPDLEKILAQVSAVDPDQRVEIRIHIAPEWRD